MLLIFPIILCSNSRRYHLLCFAFLPIMLESMIDIDVKKRLETISQCHMLGSGFARLGRGHFNRSSKETVLEIVLS